jgi:hypothetical protein
LPALEEGVGGLATRNRGQSGGTVEDGTQPREVHNRTDSGSHMFEPDGAVMCEVSKHDLKPVLV